MIRPNDLPKAVIVDMDGTLADAEWRRPCLPNFDKFFVGCGNDPAVSPVAIGMLFWRQKLKPLSRKSEFKESQ